MNCNLNLHRCLTDHSSGARCTEVWCSQQPCQHILHLRNRIFRSLCTVSLTLPSYSTLCHFPLNCLAVSAILCFVKSMTFPRSAFSIFLFFISFFFILTLSYVLSACRCIVSSDRCGSDICYFINIHIRNGMKNDNMRCPAVIL